MSGDSETIGPKIDPVPTDEQLDTIYSALGKSTEYWVVAARGPFAFRFGPYTPPEAGAIMREAIARNLAVFITGVVGPKMDWQLIEDMGCWLNGHPEAHVDQPETVDVPAPDGEVSR